jgi:protein-S-isoprenylcysteine O-methyltransferase Ste14
VNGPPLADVLLIVAWVLLIGDLLRSAARAHVSPGRRLVAVGLLATMLVAGRALDAATGGRLVWHPIAAAAGVATVWLGLGLHFWARRTLAHGWSPIVSPQAGAPLVEDGPYAYLRHPLYAAILLVGLGTLAAHCSRATLAATVGFTVGLALKRRAEDRALEERFGERWRAYARRVPAFVPRPTRARP